MKQSKFFKVERKGLDFPFYNDENFGVREEIILAIGVALFVVWTLLPSGLVPRLVRRVVYLLATLIPYLIVAKRKLKPIVKRLRAYDFVLIIGFVVLNLFLLLQAGGLLVNAGLMDAGSVTANRVIDETKDAVFAIGFVIQILGEEMFKLTLTLLVLTVLYRKTGKRKLSIIVAILINAVAFGLLHYGTYGSLIWVLVAQGTSGVLLSYLYLRTKNVLVPFLNHLLYDTVGIFLGSAVSGLIAAALFAVR